MDSKFEEWKATQREIVRENYGSRLFRESIFNDYLKNSGAACCGLVVGLTAYPRGVEIELSDKQGSKVSTDNWVVFESIQLEDGNWLNMQFFQPDGIDFSGYPERYPDGKTIKEISSLCISSLYSAVLHKKNGVDLYYYGNLTPCRVNIPVDFDWKKALAEKKGRYIVVVELPEEDTYHNWMQKLEIEHLFETVYISPKFHNRPYPPDDEDGLNYLQLKLLKVK